MACLCLTPVKPNLPIKSFFPKFSKDELAVLSFQKEYTVNATERILASVLPKLKKKIPPTNTKKVS